MHIDKDSRHNLLIIMPPGGSDWAAVSVELLSEVFTLVSLRTKMLCESVCRTWRSTLRDEPEQGLWGNLVSIQNSTRQLTIVETGGNNPMISLPPLFSHSAALAGWLLRRHKGMKQVALGYPQERSGLVCCPSPADNYTVSATCQVLSFMTGEELGESFQLAIYEMDPSLLLDAVCRQVLVKHCGALTLAASSVALIPAHLQALCSLTNLTRLEFEANSFIRLSASVIKSVSDVDLPQDLTRLTKLQKLTALSFPALPSDFSRLQHLCELYLAPPEPIPHDLSAHTLLTKLHIGTCESLPLPLALPMGPDVCLQSLILHTDCELQNLGDCKELRDLEIVPELGQRMLWDGAFLSALLHLTQLTVSEPRELHGEHEEWGKLPDQWQHYTALRKLSIPDLTLEELPEWITTLGELRILEMQGIVFDADTYFPSILCHMPKLQILNMDCIDTFIGEEVLHLAQIPDLLLLVFGGLGEDPRSSHPLPPLGDDEVLHFQQLAVALKSHPNQLMQTKLSASSNQIWTFRSIWTFKSMRLSSHTKRIDPIAFEYMDTMLEIG